MLNQSQIEAIAQADAYASNAGLPTYSELVRLAQDAAALAIWHVPPREKAGFAEAERIREVLGVFANTNGREA